MRRGKNIFIIIAALILILSAQLVTGAPMDGEVFKFRQPDNSYVEVKVYGDEYYQRVESIDGDPLIRDNEGWICIADINSEGEFVPTKSRYTGAITGKRAMTYGAVTKEKKREKREIIEKKRNKVKDILKNQALNAEGTTTMQAQAYNAAVLSAPASEANGNISGITILVDFPDRRANIDKSTISNMLNGIGYRDAYNSESVRDCFTSISNGKLTLTNQVIGYYTTRNVKRYYDDSSSYGKVQELLKEVLDNVNSYFDFRTISKRANGAAMSVSILYAGDPESGWAKGIWPHMGWTNLSYDGVAINRYQMSNIGSQPRNGTFIHESGHLVCDWPDIYDYEGDSRVHGSFGNDRVNPYFRNIICNWGTVTWLNSMPANSTIIMKGNDINVYGYRNPNNPDEGFLFENLRKRERLAHIPAEGMVIWHFDRKGDNSRQEMTIDRHYSLSLEQADGNFDFERNINSGDKYDLFWAGYKTTFNDTTLPGAKWWNGANSGLKIANITAPAENMMFTYNPTGTITPPANGVTVYQNISFGGYGVKLDVGSYTLAALNARGIANDDISSIKVPAGYKITIYEHDSYGGRVWSYTGDIANMGEANDMTSSIKIEKTASDTIIYDSRVFNVSFYYNKYPDLQRAFGYNETSLKNHWRDNGIREGRQGHSLFHAPSYLNRYPDLKTAFGTNYRGALEHYINRGISEGRYGAPNTDAAAVYEGKWVAIVAKHSGKSIHVVNYGKNNGDKIIQWDNNKTENSLWRIEKLSNGNYRIYNKYSGKIMEIGGYSNQNGGVAQQWDYINHLYQQWKIVKLSDGYYRFINAGSGKSLDVSGVSRENMAAIHQWDWLNADNQKWTLQ